MVPLMAETSDDIATLAAIGIKTPSKLTRFGVRAVCASALRQAAHETRVGEFKKRAARNKRRMVAGKMTGAEAVDDLVKLMLHPVE